jgi:hypothetical protein
MVAGGVNLPWNLALAALLALTLPFTRLTFDATGTMAHSDHVLGFFALTVISLAAAEVARMVRFLLIPIGLSLIVTPFLFDASSGHTVASAVIGAALVALSFRRGMVKERYGSWNKRIV